MAGFRPGLAIACGAVLAQSVPGPDHAADRRRDLDFLVDRIERTHPDWTHAHPRADWDAAVADLAARLGTLDDARFTVELLRLTARLDDGHSRVDVESSQLVEAVFPFELGSFADGLHVMVAAPELASAIGARVVAIGGVATDDVLRAATGLVSAEHRGSAVLRALPLLRSGVVQQALGFTDDATRTVLTIERAAATDGEPGSKVREELVVHAARANPQGRGPGWLAAQPAPSVIGKLAAKHVGASSWFECLDDEWAVYFRCDAIADPPRETLAALCKRLFAFIEQNEIERLVIDLRENGGGNNYLTQPLIQGLIRCDRVNRPGHLFVLTGPRTFSAAVNCAARIERETFGLFVGEPTGAGPNHFGDAEAFTLPSSGLRFFCSTVRWQDSDPRDRRRAILPDVPAPRSFADWIAGKDAALEAALAFAPEDAGDFGSIPPITHWRRASQAARLPR